MQPPTALRLRRYVLGLTLDEVHLGTGVDPSRMSRAERDLLRLSPKEEAALERYYARLASASPAEGRRHARA